MAGHDPEANSCNSPGEAANGVVLVVGPRRLKKCDRTSHIFPAEDMNWCSEKCHPLAELCTCY